METALVLAELLGIVSPVIRRSCYAGWEICWLEPGNDKYRIVTWVDGVRGHAFAYTRDCSGLNGTWCKVDYWFLYL
jgi:hypothetical protein